MNKNHYGTGIHGGAEALIEMCDRCLHFMNDKNNIDNNMHYGIIKLDIQNCYNSIDIQQSLDLIYDILPEWYPFLVTKYANHSFDPPMPNCLIHFNGDFDVMTNGLYQGNRLSGYILALIHTKNILYKNY